jgi:hypothetical protein
MEWAVACCTFALAGQDRGPAVRNGEFFALFWRRKSKIFKKIARMGSPRAKIHSSHLWFFRLFLV